METNPHDQNPTLPLVDQEGPESHPLASDAPDLHQRVEDLDSVVRGLSRTVSAEARTHGGSSGPGSPVYQSDEPVHGAAALQWHEAAVRCRSHIREAITNGPAASTTPTGRSGSCPTAPSGSKRAKLSVAG